MVPGTWTPYDILSLVINGSLALFTAGMAYFTARMASETRNMAKQTRASVAAENTALDQGKDALMPVLHFEWSYDDRKNQNNRAHFQIKVHNVGVGPAFIKEVTTREDVNRGELFHNGFRSSVLRGGDILSACFVPGNTFDQAYATSISLWYTDVYGRWYRSRSVVECPPQESGKMWWAHPIVHEFMQHIPRPTFSYGERNDPWPANYVGRCEEGRVMVPPFDLGPSWYTVESSQRVRSASVAISSEVANGPLQILDMTWWFGRRVPEFTLQVEGYAVFVIGLLEYSQDPSPSVTIFDGEQLSTFCRQNPPPLSKNAHAVNGSQWGLHITNRVEDELFHLYNATLQEVKAIIEPTAPSPTN
jgi:hypothetical protein